MLFLPDNQQSASFLRDFQLEEIQLRDRRPLPGTELRFFVERVKTLERNPLHRCSEGERADLLRWLVETSQFCFTPNSSFLNRLLGSSRKHAQILAAQMILSSAAFTVMMLLDEGNEHPSDRVIARAGLLGVLHCYTGLCRLDSETGWSYLDGLLRRSQKAFLLTQERPVLANAA